MIFMFGKTVEDMLVTTLRHGIIQNIKREIFDETVEYIHEMSLGNILLRISRA